MIRIVDLSLFRWKREEHQKDFSHHLRLTWSGLNETTIGKWWVPDWKQSFLLHPSRLLTQIQTTFCNSVNGWVSLFYYQYCAMVSRGQIETAVSKFTDDGRLWHSTERLEWSRWIVLATANCASVHLMHVNNSVNDMHGCGFPVHRFIEISMGYCEKNLHGI